MFLNHYTAEFDHSQWCISANFCSSACASAPIDASFHELFKYVLCFAVALRCTQHTFNSTFSATSYTDPRVIHPSIQSAFSPSCNNVNLSSPQSVSPSSPLIFNIGFYTPPVDQTVNSALQLAHLSNKRQTNNQSNKPVHNEERG